MTHRSVQVLWVTLLTIATGSFIFASCNGSNPDNSAPQSPGTLPTPGEVTPTPTGTPSISVANWSQVAEIMNCEAMNPDSCRGAYGFAVFSDGTWAAGPSPSGKTVSGKLTNEQLSTIQTDIEQFSPADLTANLVCTQAQAIPGRQDTIQIWYGDQAYTMYQYSNQAGSECYSGNDKLDARLQVDMHALMQQYYPVPFPGATPGPSPSVSMSPAPTPVATFTTLSPSPTPSTALSSTP